MMTSNPIISSQVTGQLIDQTLKTFAEAKAEENIVETELSKEEKMINI